MVQDKVALITGTSRGIGRGIATALAANGAKIVAAGTNLQATEDFVAELKAAGTEAIAVRCDVSVAAEVEQLVKTAKETFGRIDILVNNAGITRDGLLLRMKEEDWDAVLDINLKGAFLCTRAVSKLMTKQRCGRIINIVSVVGQTGNPGQANYCASKAGLMGLTRSNAQELAKRNITVNAVAPGFIATDMTDSLPEEQRQDLAARIPLARLGSVEDISHAVLFLASDHAGYITGQVIGVNGGMYM
ncbi:3-oxoacyl-[acyl-carrier-protein] reductase [Desulfuromusa kysingii]|uniref:3-oxoacyl-[acyl-carrier-protein] reductase n=1 Tax=Desulfuromusa kysingii TaxID=37625 RepID=A0A1H4D302_9BACT|nr:3-oxoacyl-[acyl-carrier-protein] reductase [Desulfuromusa kysingii]SEA66971.1 3-oxoacyl-[acyl-carrier-protein] reductase [Desulfuromusa kysingii]